MVAQTTGFCSPAMLVPKKTGDHRLVIDYRHLNACSVKSIPLVLSVADIVAKMAGKRYFSSLDLASGYWQVSLAQESQDFTTFILPGDFMTWKWTVLPFGIHSGPASFCRLMAFVFTDFLQKGIPRCA